MKSGKVVSHKHWPPLPPRKDPWYSFLLEAESILGPMIRSMKNLKDPMRSITRDLLAAAHSLNQQRYNVFVGPYFLPQRLTGAVDPHFLRNVLPELLQDVNLQTRRILLLLAIRDFFNSNDCSFACTNVWDLYILEHLKCIVYATQITDFQDLQQRTENGSEVNRTTPGIFQKVIHSLFRHAFSCVGTPKWTKTVFFNRQ
jgi:hypothetical protein